MVASRNQSVIVASPSADAQDPGKINAGQQLRGSNITVESIMSDTETLDRKTKIVCTLGPACWDVPMLENLIDAGMSVARFNFSHGDHSGHKEALDRLKTAASNKGKHVATMLDTKGPEIRSGFFADGAKKIDLTKGETLVLTSDYSFLGNNQKLACSYSGLASSVQPGQEILVADGSLVLTVKECNVAAGEVSCTIENSCSIGERKNMNLPGVVVDLPTLTDKDIDDIINFAIPNDMDFIAASFVRKASDVIKIREILEANGGKGIKIISKIENQEGMQNYDAILEATDAIMVARGDLGMEIPPEKVFLAQKWMIRRANIAGKPVVTATQMLESMINNPRPTRAECSDVANAVLDGTDCVMLSGETANGQYPVAAVTIMAQTCVEAESAQDANMLYQAVRNDALKRYGMLSTSESIASSAVKTAIDVKAKAIVCCSESGTTATQVAKFRPGPVVHALTMNPRVARQITGTLRGCHGHLLRDWSQMEETAGRSIQKMRKDGHVKTGDAIIFITGQLNKRGSTNIMRVQYA